MIIVKLLNKSNNPTPSYKTEGAAGFDLAVTEDAVIPTGTSKLLGTGIHVIIPPNHEGQLRLRSSMAKRGFIIPNAPGTIDSDYRGEIKIPVACISRGNSVIMAGERIAQLVINRLPMASIKSVTEEEFEEESTFRGSGGFGSTGSGINMAGL
jgi:dUTP pyrophosphatase